MIHTCALLHNFFITEKLKNNGRKNTKRMLHDDYHSITQQCDIDEEEVYDSSSFEIFPDGLQGTDLREIVMSIIEEEKIVRPQRNINRNR